MLEQLNSKICMVAQTLLGLLMIALTLLITCNSFSRYFLGYSLSWAEESTRYGLFFIVFIGAGVAAHSAGHLSIDMIQSIMPANTRKWHAFLVNLIAALVCVVMLYAGWQAVAASLKYGRTGAASGLPLFLIHLSLPVGAVMMCLGFLERMQKALQGEIRAVDLDSFGN